MSEQSVKITFTEHDVTTMHTELAAIRERVHKLIWVRESATSHKYLRLLQKLAAWKRDDGFDRREVIAERRALKHVCLVDDPKHPEIQVQFDPRRPPTLKNLEVNWVRQKLLWAKVNRMRQELLLTQPLPR